MTASDTTQPWAGADRKVRLPASTLAALQTTELESLMAEPPALLPIGTQVEVRDRFEQRWSKGFAVDEVLDDRYRVRRLSDDTVLPATFDADDVRRERRRETWWF